MVWDSTSYWCMWFKQTIFRDVGLFSSQFPKKAVIFLVELSDEDLVEALAAEPLLVALLVLLIADALSGLFRYA